MALVVAEYDYADSDRGTLRRVIPIKIGRYTRKQLSATSTDEALRMARITLRGKPSNISLVGYMALKPKAVRKGVKVFPKKK